MFGETPTSFKTPGIKHQKKKKKDNLKNQTHALNH